MSQAKVDLYKKEKANRKKIMAKEKRMKALRTTVLSVVCVAIVGWAGFSVYQYYEANKPAETHQVNLDGINDYLSELNTEN